MARVYRGEVHVREFSGDIPAEVSVTVEISEGDTRGDGIILSAWGAGGVTYKLTPEEADTLSKMLDAAAATWRRAHG